MEAYCPWPGGILSVSLMKLKERDFLSYPGRSLTDFCPQSMHILEKILIHTRDIQR